MLKYTKIFITNNGHMHNADHDLYCMAFLNKQVKYMLATSEMERLFLLLILRSFHWEYIETHFYDLIFTSSSFKSHINELLLHEK